MTPPEQTPLSWHDPGLWLAPLIMLLAFTTILLSGSNQSLFLLVNHGATQLPDAWWENLTVLGDSLVTVTLLSFFVRSHPQMVRAALIAIVLTLLWVHGLKPLLAIARPPAVLDPALFHIIGPAHRSGSFPSGHTAAIFTLAGLIILHCRGTRLAIIMALLIATLTGLSRIAVGVHWPLDLLAGAFGGWMSAAIATVITARWHGRHPRITGLLIIALLGGCALTLLMVQPEYLHATTLQRVIASSALFMLGYATWRQITTSG
ncbi:MAG: phosphatase PAP2 family protein [Gammaproteobacteria bacterium]|nr:phosphatase PAP2 family protein [Gammaproteobacteria bacterium]